MNTAAIVTVGTELVQGLRVDTNTAEIARALAPRGFRVLETVSVGDDVSVLAAEIGRLVACRDLVVATGGLGPTHDDITRDAVAVALGVELVADARLAQLLAPIQKRHSDPTAVARVLSQALVVPGARIIDFTTGTAPGLVIKTRSGATLALLPGPPSEMRPMLAEVLDRYPVVLEAPRQLGVVGLSESDTQVRVERGILGLAGVGFTILAKPGDVRVILSDEGAGAVGLEDAVALASAQLADHCYAVNGDSLAEVVVREAAKRGLTIALAESCTGGMVAAALTDVPGASQVLSGGVVSYSNQSKVELLGVPVSVLESSGAVSAECVEAMALGAFEAFGRPDIVVSVSGVAGPDGGSAEKPVGTVWFGVLTTERGRSVDPADSVVTGIQFRRDLASSSRAIVRARAMSIALDCIRRAVLGLPGPE